MVSKAVAPRLRMLGTFDLRAGRRAVIDRHWKPNKAKALLKLLALQPGATLHREQVIATLWPDKGADAGANNLHKAAHYLRQAFAGDSHQSFEPVILDRRSVFLDPRIHIDLVAFSDLARRAIAASTDAALYEQAIAAYAGELLPDDMYEEWTDPHRDNLRLVARRLRLELAALFAGDGRYDDAIGVILRAAQADACDEEAHALLIRICAQKGDRVGATRYYDQLTRALDDELGVAPGIGLQEILRDAANAAAAAPPPPAPPVRYVTTTDGVRIAYATIGEPHRDRVPLVQMPGDPLEPHAGVEWEIPEWRHWLLRLSRHRQVVRYDGRALGLSQRDVADVSIDAQLRDLEAVVDALGLRSFDLFVPNNSGAQAVTYMAHHPARVRRFVAYGSWVDGPAWAQYFSDSGIRMMVERQWLVFLETFGRAIAAGFDEDLGHRVLPWLHSTPQKVFLQFLDAASACDATPLAPGIGVPALGLQRPIPAVPLEFDLFQRFMAVLADVRIASVEGSYHWIAGDIEPLIAEVDAFLDASDAALAEQPRESGLLPLR